MLWYQIVIQKGLFYWHISQYLRGFIGHRVWVFDIW